MVSDNGMVVGFGMLGLSRYSAGSHEYVYEPDPPLMEPSNVVMQLGYVYMSSPASTVGVGFTFMMINSLTFVKPS